MNRNSSAKKVQVAPRHASVEALQTRRVIDATMPELREVVAEVIGEFLEAQPPAEEPSEWLTRGETGKYLRCSLAQVDMLSRRDVDPLPFSMVGDSRRFNRSDLREWVRRQRKAVTP